MTPKGFLEADRAVTTVAGVDAKEAYVAIVSGDPLQARRLRPAWRAPRFPEVDDDVSAPGGTYRADRRLGPYPADTGATVRRPAGTTTPLTANLDDAPPSAAGRERGAGNG